MEFRITYLKSNITQTYAIIPDLWYKFLQDIGNETIELTTDEECEAFNIVKRDYKALKEGWKKGMYCTERSALGQAAKRNDGWLILPETQGGPCKVKIEILQND